MATGIDPRSERNMPAAKVADGSAVSRLGLSAFYEGIRVWRISMGPYVGGDYAFSETLRGGELIAGWRTVVYAGP